MYQLKTPQRSNDWYDTGGAKTGGGTDGPQPSANRLRAYVALIDLSPIRDNVRPAEWPRLGPKVAMQAQHAAAGLTGDADTVTIHRAELCILIFGETTHDAALSIAEAVGHKIVRDVLGAEGVRRIALQPRIFTLTDLLSADVQRNLPISKMSQSPPQPSNRQKQPDRHQRRQNLRSLYRAESPAMIKVHYHPVWTLGSPLATTSALVPCLKRADGEPLVSYDALQTGRSDKDLADFDIANIERGLLDLKKAIDAGHDAQVQIPLHFTTAGSNQGRSELLDIFPNLPRSMRERLSLALYGVPSGVPQGRLQQIYITLKQSVRHVSVVLAAAASHNDALKSAAERVRSAGIPRILVSLPDSPSKDILDRTNSFVARAASIGLKVGALGLKSGPAAHRLAVAGCTIFGGTLFGGPFNEIPQPFPVHASVFELTP